MGFASGRPVDAIDRVVKRLRRATQEGVKAAAMRTLARARELAPTASGELKASGRVELRPDGAVVTFDAPHAAVVHQSPDLQHDDGQWQYLSAALDEQDLLTSIADAWRR